VKVTKFIYNLLEEGVLGFWQQGYSSSIRSRTSNGEIAKNIFRGRGMGPPATDGPMLDSSEQVYISSLTLLKMLKHGTHFSFFPLK